jgi:hypothetical protein
MRRLLYFASALLVGTLTVQGWAVQEVKDPIKEAARKREKQAKEQNYKDLKNASAELIAVSKELRDEVEKSGENVLSALIFDQLDKIEKLTKKSATKRADPTEFRFTSSFQSGRMFRFPNTRSPPFGILLNEKR